MVRKVKGSTTPHPLEPVVRAAFAQRPHQDETSLAYFLAGAVVRPGAKAYHMVARDVLGYMECQGLVSRDSMGWYVLSSDRLPEVAS